MLTLKELRESQPLLEQKSYLPSITLKDPNKYLAPATPSKKYSSEKTKLSSSQDANVMKPALLSSEVPASTFWTKLRDHFMMLFAFWFKLSRTSESSMVAETQNSKWLLLARLWPRLSRARRRWLSKLMQEPLDSCQLLLLKTLGLMLTNLFTTCRLS